MVFQLANDLCACHRTAWQEPAQQFLYVRTGKKRIGLCVAHLFTQHEEQRWYVVVRQDITRRRKTMGKTLTLVAHEIAINNYQYRVWVTNSRELEYDV